MDNSNQRSHTLVNPGTQSNQQMPGNSKKSILVPAGLGIFVVLVAIGAYLLGTNQSRTIVENSIQTAPIPSPTPDPTADWKVYKNEKYGFSLKYPNDWFIESLGTRDPVTIEYLTFNPVAEKGGDVPAISVSYSKRAYQDSVELGTQASEPIIINGINATKKMTGDPNGNIFVHITIPSGQNTVDILAKKEYEAIFDQILSTFKFTEDSVVQKTISPTPTISLDSFYQDKEFGYSIKYPSNWLFRRTYGKDVQKLTPVTDILSGIDIHDNLESYDDIPLKVSIVINLLDAHGLKDINEWISKYDLNYPKDSTKYSITFKNWGAVQYRRSTPEERYYEYIYFIAGPYAYRVVYYEEGGISNTTRKIIDNFWPKP